MTTRMTDHIKQLNSAQWNRSATREAQRKTFAVAIRLPIRHHWVRALPEYRDREARRKVAAECWRLRRLGAVWPVDYDGNGFVSRVNIAEELQTIIR